MSKITVSATQKPPPHPFYGDSYERGKDPWHKDAFPPEFQNPDVVITLGRIPPPTQTRLEGWFLIDGCGNAIGFWRDGEEIEVKDKKP